ncbi:MAG: efflux transporter outer membrane subunit [Opitutaceae bacterium]
MLLHQKYIPRICLGSFAALLLAACSTTDRSLELPLEDAPAFSVEASDAELDDSWWLDFRDDGLSTAIDNALNQNFSLKSAVERMRAAQLLARQQSAAFWPQLDLRGGGDASKRLGGDTASDQSFSGGLTASYELDVWGRLDALADGATYRAEAAEAFLQSAAISISAEVALAWYRLAGAHEQRLVLKQQVETNRKVLGLLNDRFKSGQIRAADVLRQRQLIEANVEAINDVDAQIAVLEHLLAILQGRAPQVGSEYTEVTLVSLQAAPATGLPAELLQRRPDVREAYLNLQASNADLAVAVSDRYPRVNFSGSILTNDDQLSLFDEWLASLAGQVVLPIIDGGSRRLEVERREALLSQQLADYGQTVLEAFKEVEDALALEYHQRIKIEQLKAQKELADETYRQLRIQYLNGVAEYIDVLDTLKGQQNLARDIVSARQELIEFRIALHRALAGGFYTAAATEANATQLNTEGNDDV